MIKTTQQMKKESKVTKKKVSKKEIKVQEILFTI